MLRYRLRYLATVLCLCVLSVFLTDYPAYFALMFMLVLPLPSLAAGYLLSRTIRTSCVIDQTRVEKEEPFTVRLSCENSLPLLPARLNIELTLHNHTLQLTETETLKLNVGRKASIVTQDLSSPVCGKLSATTGNATVLDPLGLWRFPLPLAERRDPRNHRNPQTTHNPHDPQATQGPNSVLVMPTLASVLPIIEPKLRAHRDAENDGTLPVVKGDDPSELFELRDYQPGDKISRVHWKLSDKHDRLIVKEYGRVVSAETLILLDLNAEAQDIDACLDALRKYSAYFTKNAQLCEVIWFDGENQHTRRDKACDEGQWNALFDDILARARPQGSPLILEEYVQHPGRANHQTLIYLGGRIRTGDELLARFAGLCDESKPCVILVPECEQ